MQATQLKRLKDTMENKVNVDSTRARLNAAIVPTLMPDAERRAMVWDMRLNGFSYAAIATALHERLPVGSLVANYSAKHAYNDCSVLMNEMRNEFRETAIEMVELEASRFDKLQAAIWERAEEGDLAAINTALAISKERRKMLGLDDPDRIKVDWRIELVELVRGGFVKPEEIASTFGDEALIEVNQLMLESSDAG